MAHHRVVFRSLLLFIFAIVVKAQSSDLTALAAIYPNCSLTCMVEYIPQSPCVTADGLNQTCVCTSETLNNQIALCASQSCTVKELLTTQNASSIACGRPVRDHSAEMTIFSLSFGGVAYLLFIIRIATRLTTRQQTLYWDDWTMLATVLVSLPPTIFGPFLDSYGIGKDIWTIPFDNITKVLRMFILGELFYMIGMALVKVSILFFFLRMFPVRRLQIAIYITMAASIGYGVAFFFATLFQCWPIPYSWEQWHGEYEGRCNNFHLQGWIHAGINIVLDLVILALPLKQLYNLDLSKRKRVSVMLMFLVGIFGTIVSAVRLKYLVQFRHTHNPTYDYLAPGYWSVVELNVCIICACMPAMYSLIKTFMPKLVSGTTEGTYGHYGQSNPKTGDQSAGRRTPRLSTLKHSTSASSDFVLLRDVEATMHKNGVSVDDSANRGGGWPLKDESNKF